MIQQLLDHVDYRGLKHGYVTCAFCKELVNGDHDIINTAQKCVEYTKLTLIKMHKFVIQQIG